MKSVIVKQVVKLFVQQFQNFVDFGLARVQLKRIREMDERARRSNGSSNNFKSVFSRPLRCWLYTYLSAWWLHAVLVPGLLVNADSVVLPAGHVPAIAHVGGLINLGDDSDA